MDLLSYRIFGFTKKLLHMKELTAHRIRRLLLTKWSLLFSLLLTFSLLGSPAFAQSQKIEGVVTDSKGVPLLGVTVAVKGGNSITTTDSKGRFSILASPGSILVFSSASFLPKEETVDARAAINVSLSENAQALENVVVIGYGTQKKVNLSGAVAQINGKDLENRPVANLTSALQGMTPGLTVVRGSGEPGSEGYNIRIRGFTSANAASALVLVDGVEQDINLIDPNDVQSISVLKDASASAIYGARAAAGVILVTTKQGSAGKTRINVTGYYE
jgi:TonB-dependent SusC/RagA subfamily outer membrane receptor